MFDFQLLAADRPFFAGQCEALVVPTLDGEYGVLSHHCNTICAIVPGELTYRTAEGETFVAAVAAGIMKIESGNVLVLVDAAERPEDIDANLARRKADEAREALLQKRSIEEYHAAQARIARAINRLNVKSKYGARNK